MTHNSSSCKQLRGPLSLFLSLSFSLSLTHIQVHTLTHTCTQTHVHTHIHAHTHTEEAKRTFVGKERFSKQEKDESRRGRGTKIQGITHYTHT